LFVNREEVRIVATVEEVVEGFNKRYKENFGYMDLPSFVIVKTKAFVGGYRFGLLVKEIEGALNCRYFGVESKEGVIELDFEKKESIVDR
jgi:hypothetical protein